MNWVNALVSGILTGGLYAMYATGLSVSFGVMRLVNLSHGDLAITSAFLATTLVLAVGGTPFWTILVLAPVAFVAGILLQRLMFDHLVGVDPAFQIVATFGLSIVIQNLLLRYYTANFRSLDIGGLRSESIGVGDLNVGVFPLLRFAVAVAVLAALSLFLARSRLGRAFRATSDDPEAARLMGINHRTIHGLATGIALGTIAIAGVFNGAQTNFSASQGPALLLFAFEAVIIGGLGSLWGTLAGGVVLGVAQNLGTEAFGWPSQLFGHLVFLAVLVVRPTGLFGTAPA